MKKKRLRLFFEKAWFIEFRREMDGRGAE